MTVYTTEGSRPQALLRTPPTAPTALPAPNSQPTLRPLGRWPAQIQQSPLPRLLWTSCPLLSDSSCRAKDICHMNPWPAPKSSDAQAHSQHRAKVSTTRKQKMPPKNCPNAASPTWQRSSPDVNQGHRPTGDTDAEVLTGPSSLLGSMVGFPVSLAVMTHLLSREERESDRFPQNSTHVNRRETANKKLRHSGSHRTAGPLQVQISCQPQKKGMCLQGGR